MSKINFSSIPSHNKIVAKTNVNPTKEQCYTIYDNITKGLPVINPKTGFTLKYDSPITQKILRICYKKYKMKKLPDVIDPRNLFGNKTPPQLSPVSSSSGSLSPPSNFKKHPSSPLPSSSSSYGPPGTPSPPSSLPSSPLPPPSPKIKKHSRSAPKIKKHPPSGYPPAARKQ